MVSIDQFMEKIGRTHDSISFPHVAQHLYLTMSGNLSYLLKIFRPSLLPLMHPLLCILGLTLYGDHNDVDLCARPPIWGTPLLRPLWIVTAMVVRLRRRPRRLMHLPQC
jgi:hypothetical protein